MRMLEISSEIRIQSDYLREGDRQNLLDNILENWKLLLGCHVGRQGLRHCPGGQERGIDTELS